MYTNNTRQLIITADDCGLSEGINTSATDLYHQGLLTTATILMNFPAVEHAIHTFQQVPHLQLGVHLNLTDGYPLTNISPQIGLTAGDGHFQSRTVLYPRAVFPTDDWLTTAEAEMAAQIEAFIAYTGRQPNHLTTHMHFHILPSLRTLVLQLAERYGVGWVRAFETTSTVIPFNFLVQEPAELFHPDNLKITPDYIISLQAWLNQEPERLIQTMLGLTGLIEIVVHPDDAEDVTYPADMKHRPNARAKERDYLLRLGVALAPHRHLFTIADPTTP